MISKQIQDKIQEIIQSVIAETEFYLVKLKLTDFKGEVQISIEIDGDQGIGIDDCATLSKKMYALIDTMEMEQFSMELSSPGIGEPIVLPRQFIRHIGKKLKVTTKEGTVFQGELTGYVPENNIVIVAESKEKGKKTVVFQPETIALENISKAIVVVSF